MVIKVDGIKVVIIEARKTRQEFTDLLNWREYKNRVGLRGMAGVLIVAKAQALEEVAS